MFEKCIAHFVKPFHWQFWPILKFGLSRPFLLQSSEGPEVRLFNIYTCTRHELKFDVLLPKLVLAPMILSEYQTFPQHRLLRPTEHQSVDDVWQALETERD